MKTPRPMSPRRLGRYAQLFLVGLLLGLSACGPGISAASADGARRTSQESSMKIRMDIDGQIVIGRLEDAAAARDFAAMLPLSMTLTDYARVERIAYLPRKLTITGATTRQPVKAGDIAYYAPWGNLAIFVEDGDGDYTHGLVRLGRVESGLPALQRAAPLKARIERIDE